MDYVVALRVGQNDVKALVNLEAGRKSRVAPLLAMRGKIRQLDAFNAGWGATPYFLDVSYFQSDQNDEFILEEGLHDQSNAFGRRQAFYAAQRAINPGMIPVVSWQNTDTHREIVRFAISLANESPIVALRANLYGQGAMQQWLVLQNILNSLPDLTRVWLILDLRKISAPPDLDAAGLIPTILRFTAQHTFAGTTILSTSFPDDKPAVNTARSVSCIDIAYQITLGAAVRTPPLTYGDYGSTNPTGSIEYINGMPVIPFACYFTPREWWQGRRGRDKEFAKYIDLAQDILALPGYHGDNFCWGTQEIARISRLGPGDAGNGNNGTWNGFRINQHICAVLDHMDNGGFQPGAIDEDDA